MRHVSGDLVAGLSHQRAGFHARPVHVGFLTEHVAMRQIFLRLFRFTPFSIIPKTFHTHSFHSRNTDAIQFYKLLNNTLKEEGRRLVARSGSSAASVLQHITNWKILVSP